MSERMKGFTCCGDCIHYNYKKHKCNLGASVVIDARNPFYDDCPIPDIPSEQEIRNKAIEEFTKKLNEKCNSMIAEKWNSEVAPMSWANAYADFKDDIEEIAEQMKEVGE